MEAIDDLVDFSLLSEAGWQPPFRTVKPRRSTTGEAEFPSLPKRSKVTPRSTRFKSGIPIDRWEKMSPAARKAAAQKFQRTRERTKEQSEQFGLPRAGAETGGDSAAERNKKPAMGTKPIEGAIEPRDYAEGWYILDRFNKPLEGSKPFKTQEEAEIARTNMEHQKAAEASLEIITKMDKWGNTRHVGANKGVKVRDYKNFINNLGLEVENLPGSSAKKIIKGKPKPGEQAPAIKSKVPLSSSGPAKLMTPSQVGEKGFYVVHDEEPSVPFAGPFETEWEAQEAISTVAGDFAQEEINELGLEPNSEPAERIRKSKAQEFSFREIDPKKKAEWEEEQIEQAGEARNELGAGGSYKNTKGSRNWEYSHPREKQLQMFEAGLIETVKDDNPDQSYLDSKPSLENLKKVWCPLILDKADPPKRPWEFKHIVTALGPIYKQMLRNWTSDDIGFSKEDAIGPMLQGTLNGIINDRGKSPFVRFVQYYIKKELSNAKKQGGVIKRPLREKGWGNQGLSSLDAPLQGNEGELGNLGQGVVSDTSEYKKEECPTCGGAGFDPGDEGIECANCGGTGTAGSNRKGKPNKCPLCKGSGRIRHECRTCDGTGRIIVTGQRDWGHQSGVDVSGGISADMKSGGMKNTPHSIVDSTGSPEEQAEIVERLNLASEMIMRIMKEAQLTPQQQQIISLTFGLDSSRRAKAPNETAKLLALIQGGAPKSAQLIDDTVKKCIRKMRNTLINTEDEELFDWFIKYQDVYGLKDLGETENLKDWAGPERPWPSTSGGKKVKEKTEDELAVDKTAPWYKRPFVELTPKEHLAGILELAGTGLVPDHTENDWLEQAGAPSWEALPLNKAEQYHKWFEQALDRTLRPARSNPDALGHLPYWQKKTGEPLETAREHSKRWDAFKAAKAGSRGPTYTPSKAEIAGWHDELGFPNEPTELAQTAKERRDELRRKAEAQKIRPYTGDLPEEPEAPRPLSSRERKRRLAAKLAARKEATREGLQRMTGHLCDLMESLYLSLLCDEVKTGERAINEVLELV